MARPKASGEQDHIWLDSPMFAGEASGAPIPVWISSATNKVPYLRHKAWAPRVEVVREIDPLALDRLDDKGANIAHRQAFFQSGGEIIEWNGPQSQGPAGRSLP